jgi:catechol 2,3-dioxygenase-like lactoylglutathione lyase family enzyme
MANVSVRYIVSDVESASAFYKDLLGFTGRMAGPGFAMLERENLTLLLSVPGGGGGAGTAMPDGRRPEPGGWNRIQLRIDDLDKRVAELRAKGARFRGEVITGRGGKQILVDDPSGNCVELFQPNA